MISSKTTTLTTSRIIQCNKFTSRYKTNKMDSSTLIERVKQCIPPLTYTSHKGLAGRIGVVGGSLEYTGAPYFAGISALKVGADLVHIFCTSTAAPVIKSYSPELIVHPLLDRPNGTVEIEPWLDRLHALVIGPGLGREEQTFKAVTELIKLCRKKNIPLVIDADGLFLISQNIEIIRNYPAPAILTPNKIEYERLYNAICSPKDQYGPKIIDFSKLGDNISILKKGNTDELFNSDSAFQWKSDIGGSGRRCGGQGDLLSGSTAIFLYWMLSGSKQQPLADLDPSMKGLLASSLAAYAAARLVRVCNERAFKKKGRSMLCVDMIECIHESFEELYGK